MVSLPAGDRSSRADPLFDEVGRELSGPGNAGDVGLLRAIDWSRTPIGPAGKWPQSLRTALSICLDSRFPILLWWGPELIMLYNNAYRPILGMTKHPSAMGQRGRECWPEIWEIIGPMLNSVMEGGPATWSDDSLLVLDRNGYPEECYFTFSYSPIRDESGGIGGVFTAVTETTGHVLGERRLKTLRELSERTGAARNEQQVCIAAAAALATNPHDVPFALVYLFDQKQKQANLAASAGFEPGHTAAPSQIDLSESAESGWPLARVACSGTPERVSDLSRRFGTLPAGPWPDSPSSALMLPLRAPGLDQIIGVLIVGLSSHRAEDADYLSFFELAAGHITAAVNSARSYEAEQQRAEALAELDRSKTVFFSNISHEFRTPLTLMLGPAEELLTDTENPLPPAQHQLLAIMHRNGLRLLKLVNTLLDFARIEAGRIRGVYEPTDLAHYTAELSSEFRSAAEQAGLHLLIDCQPLPEPIYIDREMWEKVVFNLLSNAVKYTMAGSITISMRARGRQAELTVRDTGTGIPAGELPHLFERFRRVEGAQARSQEGSGIGLALVHELVRLHGGTIAVESTVGEGSSFTVLVSAGSAHLPADQIGGPRPEPLARASAAPFIEEALHWLPDSDLKASALLTAERLETVFEPAPEPEAERPRVMVIDDNGDMRAYLRRLFGQRYLVQTEADGASALAAVREQMPDLIISDVMLPGLDGFGLLRELRQDPRTHAIPFIMLSARAGDDARAEGMEAGADDYLVKPFSARELLARTGAHLDLARLRAETALREQSLRLAAEDALRERDSFISSISHDLRTPLTTILGSAQLAGRQTTQIDGATQQRLVTHLGRIEAAAQRMGNMITDLMDSSRMEAGRQVELDRAPIDLVQIVQRCADEQQESAPLHRIHVEKAVPALIGPWDSGRLERVVGNLLSNAVKYSPAGGSICVMLSEETAGAGRRALLSVADTGIGIPAADLPHVFERFYRGGNVINAIAGAGIGLAGTRQIVEQHGGTIEVESAPEHGTIVTVRLPLPPP